jgi:hypothetical protein
MKLASYKDLPMSLVFASVSSDIEAELVDIDSGTDDSDYADGVRGKIVLTTSRPSIVYERAVTREGAAGIVSSWSVPGISITSTVARGISVTRLDGQ